MESQVLAPVHCPSYDEMGQWAKSEVRRIRAALKTSTDALELEDLHRELSRFHVLTGDVQQGRAVYETFVRDEEDFETAVLSGDFQEALEGLIVLGSQEEQVKMSLFCAVLIMMVTKDEPKLVRHYLRKAVSLTNLESAPGIVLVESVVDVFKTSRKAKFTNKNSLLDATWLFIALELKSHKLPAKLDYVKQLERIHRFNIDVEDYLLDVFGDGAFDDAIYSDETDYNSPYELLRIAAHNINPEIGTAFHNVSIIRTYLQGKALLEEPAFSSLEAQRQAPTLDRLILNLDETLNQIKNQLSSLSKFAAPIDIHNAPVVDIKELFLGEILPRHEMAKNYRISFDCAAEVSIPLDKSAFVAAIENIIRNAEIHGFAELETGGIITFRICSDNGFLVVDCMNNGKPLPVGFSTREYVQLYRQGNRKSPGEGIGGAYVQKVILAHGGGIELIPSDDCPFHLRIKIPIKGVDLGK
jgi:signal transduction histidine kinase